LSTRVGVNWKILVLGRWIITIVVIITMRDLYCLQILLLFLNSIVFQILIILYKPLDGLRDHRMSIFNELAVSLYLYLLMCLTDFHGWDNLREDFGLALFILLVFTLLINLLVAFFTDFVLFQGFLTRKFCP